MQFHFTRVLGTTARQAREVLVRRGSPLPQRVLLDSLHISIDPELAIPGGEMRFRRFDDGTVIIDKFRLWAVDNWRRSDINLAPLPNPDVIHEVGGEILKISGGKPDRY